MPATTCLLCRGPLHLTQDELKAHQVPMVGYDCRKWLEEGFSIEGLQGVAFNLEQMIMIYCLEAAVEAGHIGRAARDEADRMIGAAIGQIHAKYHARLAELPPQAPISDVPTPPAEKPGTDFLPALTGLT